MRAKTAFSEDFLERFAPLSDGWMEAHGNKHCRYRPTNLIWKDEYDTLTEADYFASFGNKTHNWNLSVFIVFCNYDTNGNGTSLGAHRNWFKIIWK